MTTEEKKERLARLRAIRGAQRSVVTKNVSKVKDIIEDEAFTFSDQVQELEVTSRLLEAKLKTLEDIDKEVLSLCSVEEIPQEIEESEKYVEKIIKCQKKISDVSQRTAGETPETIHPLAGLIQALPGGMPPPQHATNQVKAKLPKLILPKFRGDVTTWTGFWESYKSAVHDNESISKIDKFNYLRSLLEGAASRAIQGLTLSTSNYDSAVEILEQRFGRPQQIIAAHMDEILKLQPCTSDRPSSLRFLYDKLSVHVRGLSSLGVSSHEYGSLLIPIIMSKLPNEIRLEIARNSTSDVWRIDELLETIKGEIEAREASEAIKAQEVPGRKHNPSSGKLNPTASTLVSTEDKMFQIRCVYCNGEHYSASCTKVRQSKDRREILLMNNRCFICLKTGHGANSCFKTKKCRHCDGKHHQSICARIDTPAEDQRNLNRNDNLRQTHNESTTVTTTTANSMTKGTVLLQTASCTVVNGSNSIPVRVLFDNGSQRSYVSSSVTSRLKLKPVSSENLHINTFGVTNYRKQKCNVVKLCLQTRSHEELELYALNYPVICSPLPSKISVVDYVHLEGLDFADNFDSSESIDVLIGSDYYWDFVTGDFIKGDHGPTAVYSKFGWLLSGPTYDQSSSSVVSSNLIISGERNSMLEGQDDELTESLKKFWESESVGIEEQQISADKRMPEIYHNGRNYEIGFPWKEDFQPSKNGYQLSENRLRSLYFKLKRDPDLLRDYDKIIRDQEQAGIVERVPEEETSINKSWVHYSPHHAVIRKDRETTKVRIVYDGSAKSSKEELSLNDCLETGDNYIPHIFDMLSRFRSNLIGLTADIEKAFLMVSIKEEDRNMLRFLWFDNPEQDRPKITPFRFNRLLFGLRPSPSILGATIVHHLRLYKESEPEMAALLEKSFYVDDLLSGAGNEETTLEIYRKSKRIMADGGFNLRKWNCNSLKVMSEISNSERPQEDLATQSNLTSDDTIEDDQSYAKTTTGLDSPSTTENTVVKVLGLNWNTLSDELFFHFSSLYEYAKSLPLNKRSVLKVSSKIFDPMGFLSPFTICLKILFQELCLTKTNWDEELQGSLLRRWKSVLEEIRCFETVRIPRCYFSTTPVEVQVHAFSDASDRAYSAVVYLRSRYDDGRIEVKLATSKAKVAPTTKQSTPRLELLGALSLARLVNKFNSAIEGNNRIVYWCDSETTLCWIKNRRVWKQYVQNRVEEIRSLTTKNSWRHCPGPLNPADLPSRGSTSTTLVTCETWWKGPKFLYLSESEWPEDRTSQSEDEVALQEVVKTPPTTVHSLVNTSASMPENKIDHIVDINRFHDLTKLLRVTALVIKAVKCFKNKVTHVKGTERELMRLSATDVKEAERLWITSVQRLSFSKEIAFLLSKDRSSTPTTYVTQFGLFLDEGVIKCKGRLNNAPLPVQTRNPILLPAKHEFTRLLIRQTHESVKHSGIRDTLTTLRERYWVLRGREAVKRFIRSCVICRKHEGTAYSPLPPDDLPSNRVSDDPPFTHIGLDFAGPLYVDTKNSEQESKESQKVYVCLFTCASTRAVHLELTRGLSVQPFLLALRRFTSRRGLPATITSDNAKTFRSSSQEVRRITRAEEVWRYLANKQVTWNFIVEKAPWWGGFWERLVRSIKKPLKKILGRSILSFDELRTVLVEIEGVINSRPLTYVYDDEESISYPLTPSQLIYGRRITSTPNAAHYEVISTNHSLTKKSRHHRQVLQHLTNHWRREYLNELKERSQVGNKGSNRRRIAIGDLVLLKNDSTSRAFWKLGKVEELIPGRDGNVRAAIVKVISNSGRPSHLRRVLQHLVPIEVKVQPESTVANEVRPADQNTRPRRAAAAAGEALRRHAT